MKCKLEFIAVTTPNGMNEYQMFDADETIEQTLDRVTNANKDWLCANIVVIPFEIAEVLASDLAEIRKEMAKQNIRPSSVSYIDVIQAARELARARAKT